MTEPGLEPVLAIGRWNTNAAMIADVARLGYLNGRVMDVTYGKGNFWTLYHPEGMVIHDLAGDGVDFRNLPHPDGSFDAIILDGPYKLNGTPDAALDERYGIHVRATRDGRHQLIRGGITECARCLAPRGYLLVKCQDQVEGGKVRWQTRIFADHAETLGLTLVDMLHFLAYRPQGARVKQEHARRNYSSLLVLQAPKVWPIPAPLPDPPDG